MLLRSATIFEAYALITDWNMGVPVTQPFPDLASVPLLEIANPIGREITLRYSNCAQGFRASVYDASGRHVDEIKSTTTSGTIEWPVTQEGITPGVYFIVPQDSKTKPSKVVLLK